ncbi:MAG TPA: SPOR domain-containing protein [Sphingomicrobium sp.]
MRYKCLVAAMIAAAAAAPLSAQSVTAGIEAWQKSDYAGAVAIWRPLANRGDAAAQFNLGQAYRLGRGVQQDLVAAQDWFDRAARKGNVDAQAMLGMMLFQSGNQTGGLRWLRMAAEQREPHAMLIYGTALFNGDGVPRDPLLGYLFVTRAAETGLEQARLTLQRLDEIVPPEDREKALQLSLPTPATTAPPATKPKKQAAQKPVKVASASMPAAAKPPKAAAAAATPSKAAAPVKTVSKPPSASGAWRIQLGAFSKRSSAESLFGKLSAKLSGRHAFYIPVGTMTRLQVGPFESQAAAQVACSALKPQPCFTVKAD